MAAPSFQDYIDAARAEAIDRRPDLTFDEGDISEFFVAGMAAMADHLTGYFAGRFRATFLDGARGDDLTVLADDHWNVQRNPAIQAAGPVTFSRTNANGAPAGTLSAGFVLSTEKDANGNEIQYTLDADVSWTLADITSKVGNITAVVAGSTGNADLNKVVRTITDPFDSSITVTNNLSKIAGGSNEETDEDLRERVRNVPTTLRRGTLAAIEFGAVNTNGAGVSRASAVEETNNGDPPPPTGDGVPTGIVNLYVSDAQGGSSTTMIEKVQLEILNWRSAGVPVNVLGGELLTQDVTVILNARLGTDTQALAANVQAAITARIAKLKIGEALSPDIIKQAVLNVDDTLLSITVSNPAVTVTPNANQLIRAGVVTVS